MHQFISTYLSACRAEGKSPRTLEWYDQKLRVFDQWLEGRDPLKLSPADLRQFVLYVQGLKHGDLNPHDHIEGPISPLTVRGYVSVVKGFYTWLEEEEFLDVSPMRKVKLPKVPKYQIKPMTPEEVKKLLDALNKNGPCYRRHRAMLLLLFDTGLRISEALGIKMPDVDLSNGRIKVFGKGAKERYVPIGSLVQRALLHHLATRPESGYLFSTQEGKPLDVNGIQVWLSRLGKKAGVDNVHAHRFRHTFAKQFLVNGGDVFSLQRILGHSDIEICKNYLALLDDDVKAAHERHSPADKLKLKLGR